MPGKDTVKQPKRWLDVETLVRLSNPETPRPSTEDLRAVLRRDPQLHRLNEALDMSLRTVHGN